MPVYAFQTPAVANAVGTEAQRNTDRALYQTVILNVFLAALFVLLFSILRKRFKSFYEPMYAVLIIPTIRRRSPSIPVILLLLTAILSLVGQ